MLWNEREGPRPVRRISSLGPASWVPGTNTLVYSRLEFTDPYSLLSDVYTISGDDESRVTHGARVWEADPHPDGRRVIAVSSARGTNVLTMIDLATGVSRRLTEPDLDVHWSGPRWSPAGDRIAVSRWKAGQLDIAILDSAGSPLRQITNDRAVDSYPSWSPDGRFLLFSSDRTGISNLYAFDVETGALYQITNVLTGAFQPDVSPDGRWIAFSYYGSDGYYIARMPFAPERWRSASPPVQDYGPTAASTRLETEAGGSVRTYSAWPAVLPTWWSPIVTGGTDEWIGLGLSTGGRDTVERHSWGLDLIGYPAERRLGLGMAYRYRGWGNPVLDAWMAQDWDIQSPAGSGADSGGEPLPELARREREIEAALTWSHRRWRRLLWLQTGVDLSQVHFLWSEPGSGETPLEDIVLPLDAGASIGFGYSSLRAYELSLGTQDGVRTSWRAQARRYLERPEGSGSRPDYWRVTSRNVAFKGWDLYGFAPSVFAARLDGGIETSAAAAGFGVGGLSGSSGPIPVEVGTLGSRADYPIRGYALGVQRGNRVASGSVEYRFPIALLERGFRLLPVALDRLWGDVFVDGGTAWCAGPCRTNVPTVRDSPSPLLAAGAEVVLDLRIAFNADLPITAGIAYPFRPLPSSRPQFYIRSGRSF
jgi:hypothetical protein